MIMAHQLQMCKLHHVANIFFSNLKAEHKLGILKKFIFVIKKMSRFSITTYVGMVV